MLVSHLSPQAVLEQNTKGYVKIDFPDDRVRTLVKSPTTTMKITGKATKNSHFRTLVINWKSYIPEEIVNLSKTGGFFLNFNLGFFSLPSLTTSAVQQL